MLTSKASLDKVLMSQNAHPQSSTSQLKAEPTPISIGTVEHSIGTPNQSIPTSKQVEFKQGLKKALSPTNIKKHNLNSPAAKLNATVNQKVLRSPRADQVQPWVPILVPDHPQSPPHPCHKKATNKLLKIIKYLSQQNKSLKQQLTQKEAQLTKTGKHLQSASKTNHPSASHSVRGDNEPAGLLSRNIGPDERQNLQEKMKRLEVEKYQLNATLQSSLKKTKAELVRARSEAAQFKKLLTQEHESWTADKLAHQYQVTSIEQQMKTKEKNWKETQRKLETRIKQLRNSPVVREIVVEKPIEVLVEVPRLIEVEKIREVEKLVQVQAPHIQSSAPKVIYEFVEVPRFIEEPIFKEVQKPVFIEKPVYVDKPYFVDRPVYIETTRGRDEGGHREYYANSRQLQIPTMIDRPVVPSQTVEVIRQMQQQISEFKTSQQSIVREREVLLMQNDKLKQTIIRANRVIEILRKVGKAKGLQITSLLKEQCTEQGYDVWNVLDQEHRNAY